MSKGDGLVSWRTIAGALAAIILTWGGAWVVFGMEKVSVAELKQIITPLVEADKRLGDDLQKLTRREEEHEKACVSIREADDIKQRLQRIEDKIDRIQPSTQVAKK